MFEWIYGIDSTLPSLTYKKNNGVPMALRDLILENLDNLPENLEQEVLDFIVFLRSKHQNLEDLKVESMAQLSPNVWQEVLDFILFLRNRQ